jgi:hypothetical protein
MLDTRHKYQDTSIKTQVSRHKYQDTRTKTQELRVEIFLNVCFDFIMRFWFVKQTKHLNPKLLNYISYKTTKYKQIIKQLCHNFG